MKPCLGLALHIIFHESVHIFTCNNLPSSNLTPEQQQWTQQRRHSFPLCPQKESTSSQSHSMKFWLLINCYESAVNPAAFWAVISSLTWCQVAEIVAIVSMVTVRSIANPSIVNMWVVCSQTCFNDHERENPPSWCQSHGRSTTQTQNNDHFSSKDSWSGIKC